MSERYQVRPSELVGINDSFIAYQFDETCAVLSDKCTDDEGVRDYGKLIGSRNPFLDFAKKHGKAV